jgi:uncharacterized protein YbaP (TraB family)
MRKRISIVFLALLALPAYADDAGHPVTLWKVAGVSNSVYLLGSIHLLREQDYPLPTILDVAYADAEVLIMEVDMDDLDPFAAQAAFTTYGVLQDDRTLSDLMGADAYQQAVTAADAVGIPLEMLSKTEPWYAAMTIEIMMLNSIGFNPMLGVEMHMMSKAAADGKPIEGFETIVEQIQFLDGMSLQAQRDMLLATLTESANLGEMMDKIIDAWRHGDTEHLGSEMLSELEKHEELNKVLVVDRNARWVDSIEDLLDDKDDYLIIVGTLHLVGEGGVPERLRSAKHDVQQLSEPPTVR